MADTDWLTVEEVGKELRVGAPTVRLWLREGRLAGYPFGGKVGWRVQRADLEQFLKELRRPARAAS